jgi:ketosteroid isomerase-like protein
MPTTTEHPNATLVREGLEAFNRGDMQGFAGIVADDVVWHQIGAETLQGTEAMPDAMPQGEADWQITADVHDVVANDEHAIALVNATATRGDGRTLNRTAEIMHPRTGRSPSAGRSPTTRSAIAEFFA